MKEHKMTLWDAGQVLVSTQDTMFENSVDLRKGGFAKQADLIFELALKLGDEFNSMHTGHTFGLRGSETGPQPAFNKKDAIKENE